MTILLLILCPLVFSILILYLSFRWKPQHVLLRVLRTLTLAFSALFLTGFGLLVGTIIWMADPWHFKDPSDEKLISLFNQHHEAFEKLRRMAQEDAKHGCYFNSYGCLEGKAISQARTHEYKELLGEIGHGIEMNVDPYGPLDARFIFTSSGLLAIGPESSKGIEFLSDNRGDGPIVKSLDKLDDLPDGDYYRPITKHWFIFYYYCD